MPGLIQLVLYCKPYMEAVFSDGKSHHANQTFFASHHAIAITARVLIVTARVARHLKLHHKIITILPQSWQDKINNDWMDFCTREELDGLFYDLLNLLDNIEEFHQFYPSWKKKREETMRTIKEMIDWLNKVQFDVNVSRLTGASAGIVGGGLALAGLILIPFTFGASLGLTISGVAVGGSGAVISNGASIGSMSWDVAYKKKLGALLEEDHKEKEKLFAKTEKIKEALCKVNERFNAFAKDGLKMDAISITFSSALCVASLGGPIWTISGLLKNGTKISTKLAGRVIGGALIGIGAVADTVDIVFTSINVHKGSKSELGAKMKSDVLDILEIEYQNFVNFHKRLLINVEDNE